MELSRGAALPAESDRSGWTRGRGPGMVRDAGVSVAGLRPVLDLLPDAVVIVDARGRIALANAAASALFGYEKSSLVGKSVEALVPSRLREAHRRDRRKFAAAGPVSRAMSDRRGLTGLREDGTEFPVAIVLGPIELAEGTLTAAIVRDISDTRRIEEALRTTDERFRMLVGSAQDVIYLYRLVPIRRFEYVSPSATAITGYTPDEHYADPDLGLTLAHPEDRPQLERMMHSGVVPHGPVNLRWIRKDGTPIWTEQVTVPIVDESGTVVAIQGIVRDVTARRRAEDAVRESEERWRNLAETVPDFIVTVDRDGRIKFVNRFVRGLSTAQVTGARAYDFVPEEDRETMRRAVESTFTSGETTAFEVRGTGPDGGLAWYACRAGPVVREGVVAAVTIIATDVTELRSAREAARESERRYAEAYERERQTSERLRVADQVKNTFLSAVSHELRTPLTSIRGFAATLRSHGARLDPEESGRIVERLAANAERLSGLLDDLLDLDRLSRGVISPKRRRVDVPALARGVVERLEALADHPLHLDLRPIEANLDAAQVERIVENLLANAAKHTPPGAAIWLRVGPKDHGVLIVVEDEGPGLPADYLETVFEPFERGPESGARGPGTGIGLSLVARFATLHGGRAWAEARRGGGASFKVFLPRDGAPEAWDAS